MNVYQINDPLLAEEILKGAIGIIPTDTVPGLVASVYSTSAIERVYRAKQRDINKACIILASSIEQLLDVDGLDQAVLQAAERYWPGAVSVIIPCKQSKLQSVHRGEASVACRIPDWPPLRSLLEKTGPIIAPSANLQDQKVVRSLAEAEKTFGDKIDFFVADSREPVDLASTLIKIDEDNLPVVLRPGIVAIKE